MGKENPREGSRNRFKQIVKTARNVGLAVTFVGGGLTTLDACKKPSPPSQAPTGISENAPQFPNANNDRPLQRQQSAKQEAPIPTLSEKTPEGKISITKKPDQLFRALLSTAIEPNHLPSGMKAATYSAGTLDATSQALKAFGQANIGISDGDTKFKGKAHGSLSFTIFPDAETAKVVYDMTINSTENKRVAENFSYPAASFSANAFMGVNAKISTTTLAAENVLIVAMLYDIPNFSDQGFILAEAKSKEEETIALAKAGLEHLQRVGR